MTLDFYKRVGFNEPWICYFAQMDGKLVGSAGIKGKPRDGKIEIAITMPVPVSPMVQPGFSGRPPSSPVSDISPDIAWILPS